LNINENEVNEVLIPVSIGELVDKITILEIKRQHMEDTKLINVDKELKTLKQVLSKLKVKIDTNIINKLRVVNNKLWNIEDQIRIKEKNNIFDEEFIELARLVYLENDQRFSIKQNINKMYKSRFIEEKSYEKY